MRGVCAVAFCLAFAASALAAEKPRRAQPVRNPCAAEGQGFVWSRETNTCVRIGGAVGAQFGGSTTGPAYRW